MLSYVNHASITMDLPGGRLVTDPWYSGSVFNEGWRLLVETGDLAAVRPDVLWISHEHPDHFHPPTLLTLARPTRRSTPVLVHETADQKMVHWLRGAGFEVQELPQGVWVRVAALDAEVCCGSVGGFDSWLAVRSAGRTVVNVNDCVLTPDDLDGVLGRVGRVETLLIQWSFASWIGNRGDARLARRARQLCLDNVGAQVDALRPDRVVLFANMAQFSRTQNVWMNEEIVPLEEAADLVIASRASPIVPLPNHPIGDEDIGAAIAYWRDRREHGTLTADSEAVHFDDLDLHAREYVDRIRCRNDVEALHAMSSGGDLPPTVIYLPDIEQAISLDVLAGIRPSTEAPDLVTTSADLDFVLRHDWGRGTLLTNACFEADYSTLWRFMRQTQIAYANNIGKRFGYEYGAAELIDGGMQSPRLIRLLSSQANV
jgi:UDP-MurNAc hydroxylase